MDGQLRDIVLDTGRVKYLTSCRLLFFYSFFFIFFWWKAGLGVGKKWIWIWGVFCV